MGETFVGLVRNIPTRVPSALVVRTHLADLVYTLLCSLCSSLADVSRFHMKIFFFFWGGGIFWCKYATCTSNSPGWPCVYALVLNLVFCMYWPGLNWSKCCKIFHTDQIFLPSVICRSRQDSMSLLSQTFSEVILQIVILHFNDSFSGTSI